MPECLQQQLINSRVVKPRGCNEETERETGERHKGRSKVGRGNEGILLKKCQLEKGKANVPSRWESCVPCYLRVALWVLCEQNGKT